MLDVNRLLAQQKRGDQLLVSLGHEDTVIIQNFSLMSSQALIKAGLQAKKPTNDIILNAYRTGIALGLGLDISGGKLKERG